MLSIVAALIGGWAIEKVHEKVFECDQRIRSFDIT